MKNDKTNDRRNFLRTAGAALMAASVPAAALAQNTQARPSSGNNMKQLILFGGVSEPLPSLPGIFGPACLQLQMRVNLDGSGGFGTLSDPVFTQINSHLEIRTVERGVDDIYIFRGTCRNSNSPEFIGRSVIIKTQVLPDDNCNVSLTVEDTPIAGLLLPAIQKVRDKI